jgi:phosphopantetheinyl transferase (holo-ACP synthase)
VCVCVCVCVCVYARWAVKEAAFKALATTHGAVTWKQVVLDRHTGVHVGRGRGGTVPPRLQAVDVPAAPALHVSVTHDGDYTAAMVVATHAVQT